MYAESLLLSCAAASVVSLMPVVQPDTRPCSQLIEKEQLNDKILSLQREAARLAGEAEEKEYYEQRN